MIRKKVAVLLAASALSIPAYAADDGWYLLGAVGQTKAKDFNGFPPGVSVDDTDTGFKLGAGYMFNKNIGVEAAYLDFGKVTASAGGQTLESKASGEAIVAVGVLPVNKQFSVLGRLGFINATVKTSVPGTSVSSTDMKLTWGIGGQFNATQNLGIRLDYDSYNKLGDNDTTGESTVDMISLGVVYKF